MYTLNNHDIHTCLVAVAGAGALRVCSHKEGQEGQGLCAKSELLSQFRKERVHDVGGGYTVNVVA